MTWEVVSMTLEVVTMTWDVVSMTLEVVSMTPQVMIVSPCGSGSRFHGSVVHGVGGCSHGFAFDDVLAVGR